MPRKESERVKEKKELMTIFFPIPLCVYFMFSPRQNIPSVVDHSFLSLYFFPFCCAVHFLAGGWGAFKNVFAGGFAGRRGMSGGSEERAEGRDTRP